MISLRKKIILTFLLLSVLPFLSRSFVYAQFTDECQSMSGQDKVNCYAKKVNELKGQANTLSSQIAVMDSQVKLTEARIAANEKQISDLTLDIDTTNKKISGLQAYLEKISQVLINRIRSTYKVGTIQPLYVLLSSNNGPNFLTRLNSLRIAQAHDRKLIIETTAAKNDYANQKNILEDKKKQIEALKKQLEDYSAQLAQQKIAKQALLKITQNDEVVYQKLLNDALSIQRALANVGAKIGNVERRDIIASAGNTGCSTGSHLHFEVYERAKIQGGRVVDVNTGEAIQFKISDHLVNPMNYINGGQFQHPLPGSVITTSFMEQYFRGAHTGVDFAYLFSDRPTNGQSISAAEKGVAYLAQDSQLCSGFEANGIGKGIIIDHQNGLVTLYWHIQ